MAADYKIQVLGGLSFSNKKGEFIELSSRKAEAIIIYLLFSEKASCEREELATLLWEDMPETNAMMNLRVTLTNIRKQLNDLLIVSRRHVSLNPEICIEADGLSLDQAVSEIIYGKSPRKELLLEQARSIHENLLLYHGDFLQGFFIRNAITFEDWAAYKRESLRRGVIESYQLIIHSYRKNQLFIEGINAANQLLFIDPYNDSAYNWLIELQALNGQREKALKTYDKYVETLNRDFGVEPTEEIQVLVKAIQSGNLKAAVLEGLALEKTNLPIPNNIPTELSAFFGRKAELAQLRGHLINPHQRLVTIIGQGGSGKTRLAIEAVRENIRAFPDGVWFVPLESVVSADLILHEVFRAMGITYPQPDRALAHLVEYLNGHHVLLVLDNFEQLLDASPIISEVIQNTENSKIILTSREMTGLPEETNMFLDGLEGKPSIIRKNVEISESLSPAAEMFINRASRVDADFKPKNEDLQLIEEICTLVACLPLGIELSATGIKKFSLQEIHDHIACDIAFLASDHADLPERQRSLQSVLNTFWEQLTPDEQRLISRLSTFCGILTQDAAKKVAGISVFFLSNLVARGFLKRIGAHGYRAHSMHRQFVREKLKEDPGEFAAVSEKHRDYYFKLLNQILRSLRDSPQKSLLDELELEMCNIRTALQFSITRGEKQKALEMCELLMPFWKIRGYYQEGYHWLEKVFSMQGIANPVMESSALCAAAKLAIGQGDIGTAENYSRKSLQIAHRTGDQRGIARALNSLGAALSASGNKQKAVKNYIESLDIYRNLRVQQAIAGTLVNLASIEAENGNIDMAVEMLDEAMSSFRLVGDSVGIIHALQASAKIALTANNGKQAEILLKEALEIAWKLSARDELLRIYILLANAFVCNNNWTAFCWMAASAEQSAQLYQLVISESERKNINNLLSKAETTMGLENYNNALYEGKNTNEEVMIQNLFSNS